MTETRRAVIMGAAASAAALEPLRAEGAERLPTGYPRSYLELQAEARREGALSIYSSADLSDMTSLLRAFTVLNPGIRIAYDHLNSSDLNDRFLREIGSAGASADFLFSSAMDTQIKLVNDGYAQSYASPEKPALPAWALWKNQAYGLTAEPIVFAYNSRLLPRAAAPYSHFAFEQLLRQRGVALRGKVGTYDVEHSSTGFLFLTQDVQISHDTWRLLEALGAANPRLDIGAHDILARVASGEQVLAYNVMSSYALEQHTKTPWVEVVFPSDYTLVMSRIGFISRDARHPSAAKLFLDFLLSRQGQALLADRYMTPVRTDLPPPPLHGDPRTFRAIHVGPELIANLDRLKHAKLIKDWKRTVGR